ncbi:hypothetical protein IB223_16200 [Pseudoxanthomonas sp. PXM03]|uniref:hypothetical protein n=1 Tax=Pseudoxanthomonas sp. PXM03 TaxID=2769284 RepID=UPI0017863E11|nr:hypothetical protein [Pseudoxanthomonas sp. PXM03]MBD9437639.1 hypothetical protein [Pseudoxanthomonas sp. PXM03]
MSTTNKIFVVIAILLAAVNLIDFVLYGQKIRNLAGAAGFALMAFGTYKDLNWASIFGAALALAAIVAKYVA